VRLAIATVLVAGLAVAPQARADGSCYAELESRNVAFKRVKKSGVANAVEIIGLLGGVEVAGPGPLVIDCSLAVSLDEVGRYMRALGVDKALYSSALAKRNVRGTNRPSKHSYGLAIDVAGFSGADLGLVRVDRDYEQGLGDGVDCVGQPLTQAGAVLKVLQCQLVRSGLFHLVLSPDYDDAHHDHFHLEVKPWRERGGLRAATPAIH
jgi:hypothetical protein